MTQKFIDRDGLKVLWNQVNLKDYPNNETLMAVIDAIDETKADKDELFSKSWNDLTDRPFYEETTISENIIINTEHDFTTGALSINNLATVANEVVKITVNENEEYTATVFYVGNPIYEYGLRNFSEGCPFEYDFGQGLIDTTGTLGNVNIKITNQSTATAIKKIDEKYLPQLIGKATDEGGEIFNYYLHESRNENFAGYYSHAEGLNTKAKGQYSHAEGCNTTASSDYSHVEGNDTTASGTGSHAEGHYTTASGSHSHAEGDHTTASGASSHAEGEHTTASGTYSHAEGYSTTASGAYSHVQGKYNIADVDADGNPLNNYAHIVGNGTSEVKRSNAHTLDWDGNANYAGDVYVGNANENKAGKKLATEEFVENAIIENAFYKPIPIESIEPNATGTLIYYNINIENLEKDISYYFNPKEVENYPNAIVHMGRVRLLCDDGSYASITNTFPNTTKTTYLEKPYDTKWYLSFDNNEIEIDFTDRSTSSAVITKRNYNAKYLLTGNNAEYIPDTDYSPATKKYVDDSVTNIDLSVYETTDNAQAKLEEAKSYADTSIANLVNNAPETLDTLGELATAMQENQNVVDTLNQAITNKADKSALDSKLDANKYVVDSELSNSSTNPVQNKVVKEYVDSKVVQSWNDLEDKPFGEYAEEFEIADKEIPFTSNSYRYSHGSLLSEPANKISVYWNGIKYECESIFIDDIRYGYGNCRLYGDYYDSGEPFALIFDTTNGNTTVIKNNNETETVSCKIAGYEEGIKLIDDKYISYKLVRNYDVLEAANQNSSSIDYSPRNPHNLATKEYVDDLELITIEDINTICEISIQKSEEVLF